MPFIEQRPRPFTLSDIQALSPNQKGVYGLFNESGWIYIGEGSGSFFLNPIGLNCR